MTISVFTNPLVFSGCPISWFGSSFDATFLLVSQSGVATHCLVETMCCNVKSFLACYEISQKSSVQIRRDESAASDFRLAFQHLANHACDMYRWQSRRFRRAHVSCNNALERLRSLDKTGRWSQLRSSLLSAFSCGGQFSCPGRH